jgi:outer membrane protein assembly factor BamB
MKKRELLRLNPGLLGLCMALTASIAHAEDWPGFRGPTGQGISHDPNPPLKWSATENVTWAADIPGAGWSSPIVFGDRVFLTSATEEGANCRVLSVDRKTGKLLWDVEVFKQPTVRKENKNSWATPTPATDGKRVYAWFGGGAAAVTFDGKLEWTNTDNIYYSRHGLGASPLLYDGMLILPYDGSNPVPNNNGKPPPEEYEGWQKAWDKSYVVALDAATGKQKWKTSRQLMTRISHVTPLAIEVEGRKQIISPAGDYVESLDPQTGKPLWWVRSEGETPVPSVIYAGGMLFTVSGWPKQTIRAVKPGGKDAAGDLTDTHIVWQDIKVVPTMPSFVYANDLLFAVKETGIAACREPATGKIIWQQRLEGAYSASPVFAAGRIYFLNEAGKMTVIEAGPEFKVLAENEVGQPCQASPAFSEGQIFLRTDKRLLCIGSRSQEKAQ